MSHDRDKPTTNMRRYRRDSEKKFLALVLFTLVFVGGGLIALIFGLEALLTALPCLLGGAALMLGLWLLLTLGEWWLGRREQSDREALDALNGSYNERFQNNDDGRR
jgi:protein-S-isoprenylcysteine O-methyltransferase Ste14